MALMSEKKSADALIRRRDTLGRIETREAQRLSSLSSHLNVMIKAVQKAGRSIVRDFGEISQLQVRKKGPGDFVSSADINVESILIEMLQKARPDYGFISEERGVIAGENKDFTWIIDPIDGTTNFVHAIPYFSISVALKHRDEIIAAVLFNPITNELYYAEKGQGAFLMAPSGNKRLRVSGRGQLADALVGVSGLNSKDKNQSALSALAGNVAAFRHFGSMSLELVGISAGTLDAVVLKCEKIWDWAAGILFVTEAGGKIATLSGGKRLSDYVSGDFVIAANVDLWTRIERLLKKKED